MNRPMLGTIWVGAAVLVFFLCRPPVAICWGAERVGKGNASWVWEWPADRGELRYRVESREQGARMGAVVLVCGALVVTMRARR